MSTDSAPLLATLMAAGATTEDCWNSLIAEGFPPPKVFQTLHEIRKDSCATVLLACWLVYEASEEGDFSAVAWLATTLRTCGIHPYSVECSIRAVEDHGWWRHHPDFSSQTVLPYQRPFDESSFPCRFLRVDFRSLENLELVFPLGVTFKQCQLPPRFAGGLSTPSLTLTDCPGLKDMQGINLLPRPHSTPQSASGPPAVSAPCLTLEEMPELEGLCPNADSYWSLTLKNCPQLKASHPIQVFDEFIFEGMEWEEFPDHWIVDGNLTLADCTCINLPKRIRTNGSLTLRNLPRANRWPADFHCGGDLTIADCPQLYVPADVQFGNGLCLARRPLSDPLLLGRQLFQNLTLVECPGDALPNGISIHDHLGLQGLQLHSLPPDIRFHSLSIHYCPHLRLPETLTVEGDFVLDGGTLATLATGLRLFGHINALNNCKGKRLPGGFQAREVLILLNLPELEDIPEDLEVTELVVNLCPELHIPDALAHRLGRTAHHRGGKLISF